MNDIEPTIDDVMGTLGAYARIPPFHVIDDEYDDNYGCLEPCPDDWTLLVGDEVNDAGVVSWKRVTCKQASLPSLSTQWFNDWKRRVAAGAPTVKLMAPEEFIRTGRWPKGQELLVTREEA